MILDVYKSYTPWVYNDCYPLKTQEKFLIARKNPFKYILIDLLRRRTQTIYH